MASSEQKRQKKLAKHQARARKTKRDLARKKQELSSMAGKMRLASRFPVFDCKISEFEGPLPYLARVILGRRIAGGEIAVAVFLLDCGCLGVKDAFGRYCTPGDYQMMLEKMERTTRMIDSSPERARALVDQTVAYAAKLGFSPHIDFHKAYPLFGDVDASQCSEVFPLGGPEGKPTYVNGPFEDAARQRAIVAQLTARVGEGNFHFMIGGPLRATNMLKGAIDDDGDSDEEFDDPESDAIVFDQQPSDQLEASRDVDATDWNRLE